MSNHHSNREAARELPDVVKRNSEYVLFVGKKPYLTPEGYEISHHNPRPVQHLLRELFMGSLEKNKLSACMLYRTVRLQLDQTEDPVLMHWRTLLAKDPLIDREAYEKALGRQHDPAYMMELLEQQAHLSFLLNGLVNAVKCVNDFLVDSSEGHFDFSARSPEQIGTFFQQAYEELATEERAAVQLLCAVYCCGILLPLVLVTGHITVSEFANALYGLHPPLKINVMLNQRIFFDYFLLPEAIPTDFPDWKQGPPTFQKMCSEIASLLDYLKAASPTRGSRFNLTQIIQKGECFNTEFKTTMRWNIRSGKKDSAIEHAVLKTVNAFLNSAGGILLIGVRDDASVAGLDDDAFASEDKFSLHFWNMIKASMGQDVSPLIRTSFEPYEDKNVFIVQCSRSPQPVFLHQKGFDEEFYIRVGPSSAKLSVREALNYVAGRFEASLSA